MRTFLKQAGSALMALGLLPLSNSPVPGDDFTPEDIKRTTRIAIQDIIDHNKGWCTSDMVWYIRKE